MNIRTGHFIAYLDNKETVEITYSSDRIKRGMYDNKILSCMYQGVDISPCFKHKRIQDIPMGIYEAIENNAESLWAESLEPA